MFFALGNFGCSLSDNRLRQTAAAMYLGSMALLIVFYYTDPHTGLDLEMMQGSFLYYDGALAAAMLRGAPFDKMIIVRGRTVAGVLYVSCWAAPGRRARGICGSAVAASAGVLFSGVNERRLCGLLWRPDLASQARARKSVRADVEGAIAA